MRAFVTCYFWTVLGIFTLGWLLAFAASAALPSMPSLSDLPSGTISVTSMVGLGAFVFRKRLGRAWFWKAWLWVAAAHAAYVFVFRIMPDVPNRIEGGVQRGLSEESAVLLVITVAFAVAALVVVPMLIGLYLYAFESQEIWSPESRSEKPEPAHPRYDQQT